MSKLSIWVSREFYFGCKRRAKKAARGLGRVLARPHPNPLVALFARHCHAQNKSCVRELARRLDIAMHPLHAFHAYDIQYSRIDLVQRVKTEPFASVLSLIKIYQLSTLIYIVSLQMNSRCWTE